MAVAMEPQGKMHTVTLDNIEDYMEVFYEQGWTDGLPVVPPTERSVRRMLDMNGYTGPEVIAGWPARNRAINAEQIAINCVMAGCKPEYMPVLVAAMEAMAEPEWSFTHVAGRCSVWPLLLISGPIVDQLGFNTDVWALAGGDRPSMTVGRALSLIMWNCLEVNPNSILRGCLGNAGRYAACLAEKQDSPWDPIHIQEGFPREASTVTVTSVYSECGRGHFEILDPHLMAEQMTYVGFNQFHKTHYVINMGIEAVEFFASVGWTKEDLRQYLFKHVRRSVADLKRSGRWAWNSQDLHDAGPEIMAIRPGDEEKFIYLFDEEMDEETRKYLFDRVDQKPDIFLVCAGGDSGYVYDIRTGHSNLVTAVTKEIRMAGSR